MKMEKRISYYTRKVAEYGAIHVTKRSNKFRKERLIQYKSKLHLLIELSKNKEVKI